MKTSTLTVCLLLSLLQGSMRMGRAEGATTDFSRYELILARKPFGSVPLVVTTNPSPTSSLLPPPDAFIKDYRMCAITEKDDGEVRVGLVEIKGNKPYYLRLGESCDGLTLVDADFQNEGALVRKDSQEYWIYIKGTTATGAGAPPPPVIGLSAAVQAGAAARPESYADRLRKRREAVRERKIEPPKMTEEELDKHLKQYQMELIRAGGEKGPPLPVQLTPEMDAQLVSEGVLPPQE